MQKPTVHFVGSYPLDTAEETMVRLSSELPGQLLRIPDGEPGVRNNFTEWQLKVWPDEVLRTNYQEGFQFRREHMKQSTFDEAAISSYRTFRSLRDKGLIPPGVRFQVCLPTPINVVNIQIHPSFALDGEAFYEELLQHDLKRIQVEIPHDDLSIQWDMAVEQAHMEHAFGQLVGKEEKDLDWQLKILVPYYASKSDSRGVLRGIVERVCRYSSWINDDVEIGFHLCYGDREHQHFLQPLDTSMLVLLMNALTDALPRAIAWFHIPVPKSRKDDAYFLPLADARIKDATLMIGLVHCNDNEGTQRRLEAAQKVYRSKFGIANECGMGRDTEDDANSIFAICRSIEIY